MALLGFVLPANAEVVRHPIAAGTNIDIGQIMNGELYEGEESQGQFLSRTGVYLMQSATINEKLDVTIGVGGLFWYSLPADQNAAHTRLVKFGPGVGQASGLYRFGDAKDPAATVQLGFFPHKYNPDAKNLGEYQFRSGTYPGYLWTGGWAIINSAAYMAQGARVSVPTLGKTLTHDFTLYMERDFEPTYDFSPSYLVNFKPNEIFDVGAGVTYAHGLSVKPSLTTPKSRANAYYGDSALPTSEWGKVGLDPTDPRVIPDDDPRVGTKDPQGRDYVTISENGTIPNSKLSYYTFKGIKLTGRASFNLQSILQSEMLNPQDLKLYGEIAVLGVQNYPFYYDKISERMPIMAGINLPTFKVFDILSVEVEYFKSRFQNNIQNVFRATLPTWRLPPDKTIENYQAFIDTSKIETEDDIHWSVYGKKTIVEGLDLYVQVASDHMRVMSFNAEPSALTITRKPTQWYYLAQIQMGF